METLSLACSATPSPISSPSRPDRRWELLFLTQIVQRIGIPKEHRGLANQWTASTIGRRRAPGPSRRNTACFLSDGGWSLATGVVGVQLIGVGCIIDVVTFPDGLDSGGGLSRAGHAAPHSMCAR